MKEEVTLSKVAMYVTRGCLVVPIQVELHDELMLQIQEDILERVNKTGIKGVIIDVSGVAIIDSFLARVLSDTAKMASLLGAKMVITGLAPGVVASLIDLDFELKDVPTAISLEQGFLILAPVVAPDEELEEADELEEKIEHPEEGDGEDEQDETDKNGEIEAEEEESDNDEE